MVQSVCGELPAKDFRALSRKAVEKERQRGRERLRQSSLEVFQWRMNRRNMCERMTNWVGFTISKRRWCWPGETSQTRFVDRLHEKMSSEIIVTGFFFAEALKNADLVDVFERERIAWWLVSGLHCLHCQHLVLLYTLWISKFERCFFIEKIIYRTYQKKLIERNLSEENLIERSTYGRLVG